MKSTDPGRYAHYVVRSICSRCKKSRMIGRRRDWLCYMCARKAREEEAAKEPDPTDIAMQQAREARNLLSGLRPNESKKR